ALVHSRGREAPASLVREDQAGVPVVGGEVVRPADERGEPVSEAGQVYEVKEEPAQPAEEPAHAYAEEAARELRDPGAAADDRHVAEVCVAEGLGLTALDPHDDVARSPLAALDRHLRDLWVRLALRVLGAGEVACDEHVGIATKAQVRFHGHAEAALQLDAQVLTQRMAAHSGRPDDRLAGDELARLEGDALGG